MRERAIDIARYKLLWRRAAGEKEKDLADLELDGSRERRKKTPIFEIVKYEEPIPR